LPVVPEVDWMRTQFLRSVPKSVGISLAEVILGQEGELVDVVDALDILGFDTLFVHQIAIVGDIVVDIFDLPDDLLILDLENFLP